MKLPSLSSSMYVARLRHIQSIHEAPENRNPDTFVRHFLPILRRLRSTWLGRKELAELRTVPFYYYLIARTKYYDSVFTSAVEEGTKRIVMVGCGSDTRAYRFQKLLRAGQVKVLECDQAEAIHVKQRMAMRWRPADYVGYLSIDLNDDTWPDLGSWLGGPAAPKTLVMMEGVSGYINDRNFQYFLKFLGGTLPKGSLVAYDFKIRGQKDDMGRGGRTENPFRLSQDREEIAAFHREFGLELTGLDLSSDLCTQMLPSLSSPASNWFAEDGLLRFSVA